MSSLPLLTILILLPILSGVALLFLPAHRVRWIRFVALVAASLAAALSCYLYAAYDHSTGGYQFLESIPWIPAWGISYSLGVDGISLPLILLTGVVMLTGVLISLGLDDRPREFFAFLFILASGVYGVFASLDLFQLFFFYELAVFPMFLLIAIWGWQKTREYAAMKLTLYLFAGSVVSMVGALVLVFSTGGPLTFDLLALENANLPADLQILLFPFVFLGFAVLGGLFPFHNWSPDGHVAAPTAVSMFHAGVLMKLGAFAALRVGILLLPEGARVHLPWIMLLALVNVLYGAFIAMVQTDFKYVIGFSSVSHMGLVMLGFSTLNREGMLGAGLQMFSHGVMTALFFAVVGMVYDRTHTREITRLGGLAKKMPLAAFAFIIGGLVSMGMPGFSGFIAEFPIFLGLWKAQPVVAVLAAAAILITAAYILIVVRRVFFGRLPEPFEKSVSGIFPADKIALWLMILILVGLGVFPGMMAPLVSLGVNSMLALTAGG